MRKILLAILFIVPNATWAYDGLTSEISHAAGGALMAGFVTKIIEDSPNRVWIGVSSSATLSFLAESRQVFSKDAKVSSSLLDFGSHAVGSMLGAWLTDRYLLTPILTPSYSGILMRKQF